MKPYQTLALFAGFGLLCITVLVIVLSIMTKEQPKTYKSSITSEKAHASASGTHSAQCILLEENGRMYLSASSD